MTTYNFTGAVAYDRLGSSWRTAAGLRSVSVTDPATGLLPANLTQGGLAVTWLTADANSRYSFTCDIPGVVVDFGAGSQALYANEVPGMAIAAGGATSAAVDARMKWAPLTVYTLGQQILSPNSDVVKANVAHTSAAAYATDVAKWVLSTTFAPVAEPVALTKANKAGLRVSVWDYGVVGDGVADDSAALQAAITAAGVGGYIDAGKGTHTAAVFKCLTGLTMLNFQTLDGSSFQVGVGPTAAAEIRFPSFTAAEVGLTLGDACVVKNLLLRGPGSAVGTCKGVVNVGAPQFHNVSFIHWATGALITGAYYTSFWACEFSRNATGLTLVACLNLSVFGTRFYCKSSDSTTYGVGINTGTVRSLNVIGGSMEQYATAIVPGTLSAINVEGVYFESAGPSCMGIAGTVVLDKTSLNISGCMVYLAEHNRWVNFSSVTASTLNSHGNHFTCGTTSSTAPFGYVFGTPQATTEVTLSGDSWVDVVKAGASYSDNTATYPMRGWNVNQPLEVAGHGARSYWGRTGVALPGTTANPSLRIPHGVAPTTPVDGDMWTTTAGLYVRINGVTVGPLT